MRRLALALVALAAGCGGSSDDEPLTVYAAASLTEVFEQLEPDARFNFAGSDELATQLREGAPADVYAAASPRYPAELEAEGLVEQSRVFATNRLVLVTRTGLEIGSVAELASDGVKLVVAAEGVPVGDYTRTFLARLGEERVLENVVSEEEDVKGVLGKVRLGEADAGFVYATDARAAGVDVRTVELPARAQEPIRYPVAIVAGTPRRAAAERFVERLLGDEGRRALQEAGFGPP